MSDELICFPEHPAVTSIPLFAAIVAKRQRILDSVIGILLAHPAALAQRTETSRFPPTIKSMLPLWLQGMSASASTLVRLSDKAGFHTRDCFGITRTVGETAVNVCFTIAMGDEIAARAERHALQKSYRDFKRESVVGSSHIEAEYLGRPEAAEIQGLEEALNEFTRRKTGREKDWLDIGIDERIAKVGEELGHEVLIRLHGARFSVYRHSSEILHGTFFGAIFFLGALTPRPPGQAWDLQEHFSTQHLLLLQIADPARVNDFETVGQGVY